MFPGNPLNLGRSESGSSHHSFHDQLLSRSQKCRTPRKKRLLDLVMGSAKWGNLGIWTLWLASEALIFLSGIGLGVGLVLSRQGEWPAWRLGMMVAAGLGLMMLTMVARLLIKHRRSSPIEHQLRELSLGD